MVSSAPLCTPPIPPVTKNGMSANAAQIIVDATVVAPMRLVAMISGKSRRETLATFSLCASVSKSASFKPILIFPFIKAIVAGTAPWSRMICSTFLAISIF